MKRTRYSSVSTSDITAEMVVDGRRAAKKVTTNGFVTLHQRYIYRGNHYFKSVTLIAHNYD